MTKCYGLSLSTVEAQKLVQTRNKVLKKSGRIEFGGGIIDKLIKEFCDSPFLFQFNYIEMLSDLLEIFYYFKNESLEEISDDELIVAMKKFFDNNCKGSIELLQGRELERLAHNIQYRKEGEQEENFGRYEEEKQMTDEKNMSFVLTDSKKFEDFELENIQLQLLQILQKQLNRYTSGESSSVPIETAQKVIESIVYIIKIKLCEFSLEKQINLLKKELLQKIY